MTNPSVPLRAWRTAHVLVDSLKTNNAFEAAAAIAFWFFLSLLPLLVLLGFLVGLVARSKGVDALVSPVLDVVPTTVEDVLRHELDRMVSTSSVAPLGVIGFLWTASSGLHNLMDALEATAKVLRRPWWLQRAIALGWVLLGLATACPAAWLLVRADSAIHTGDPAAAASIANASASAPASSASPPAASAAAPAASSRAADHASRGTLTQRGRGALKHRLHKALHTPAEQLLATGLVLVLGMGLLAGFYRYS
ncbi:MAG TPA: YhjD/YihY/BrkB family envelope integrity protein, partial [Polyangiaceae bacterium]